MILRMPLYYKKFKCIAGKCNDSCCIGWEIDIDKDSMDFYRNIKGEFGETLRGSISEISVPHFILDKNQRCPFLDKDNLCKIFINLGEEKLCRICTEHPRYFEWYKNIKEGGIGLCCEAAAKIILTYNNPFSYYDTQIPFDTCGEYDENFYNYLFEIREKIIEHLNDQKFPLKNRLNNILQYTYDLQSSYDNFNFKITEIKNKPITSEDYDLIEILKLFNSLESMESKKIFNETLSDYENIITVTKNLFENNPILNKYLENAAIYFIWRHFLKSTFEEEFYSKAAFSVLSAVILGILFAYEYLKNNKISEISCIRMAVYYSKEIEYSEENLNTLFDNFYNNKSFSIDNLEKILNIF